MSNNGQRPSRLDELNREGRRVQELVGKLDAVPDPSARAIANECIESLVRFYGQGLARILELVEAAGGAGQGVRESLLGDPAVRGLLLIHDLHPVPLEARLLEALEKVRPYMESHGGNVELVSLEDHFAKLRLEGHCKTCPSSTVTMELAIRSAIEEACPDLMDFEVEGVAAAPAATTHIPHGAPEWSEIPNTQQLAEGAMMAVHASEAPLIVCRIGGQFYAYRDHCPACNMPLHLGAVDGDIITCTLGHRYDARRAGRSLDEASRHLDPLPLLEHDGAVRVALARESGQAIHPA